MPINSFLYPGAKVTPAYEVANSCRFNKASSDYLTRTPSGTGNQRTWTFSAWVKRSQIHSAGDQIFQQSHSEGNYMKVYFYANKIYWRGQTSEANSAYLVTNRLFRDVSAWYHIVARFDSTNSTAGDRMRLYINGVEETSFSTDINPSLNYDSYANTTNAIDIGRDNVNATSYFDGYMTEVCMVDGQSLDPTSFGEFDEDSPTIWKPKDVSGLTFGTNGFYLDFEDSSALGNDVSGNNNDFTVNNLTSVDQSTDTCTNNFAVLNSIHLQTSSPPTFSNGNLTIASIGDNDNVASTFSGEFKWYYEAKILQNPDGTNGYGAGVGACHIDTFNYAGWKDGNRTGFQNSDTKWYSNSLSGAGRFVQGAGNQVIGSLTQATAGDIVGVACDSTNGRIYIHINGTYQNSGDPAGGSGYIGGTTGKSGIWFPWFSSDNTQGTLDLNFGSAPYAISSGNSDGNGHGNFEYAVPSGYYSLNTKNLAEFG